MPQPILSIVMPAFNRPQELGVMVDSIIASTFKNWELIIMDDGSDEETLSLLHSYAQRDNRIAVYNRPREPKGAQTCRNEGFRLSHGEYVIFFDSDDYITPLCLEHRVTFMQQHPHLDFAVFPSASIDGDEMRQDLWTVNFGYKVNKNDLKAFLSRRLPFVVWNNIYRTSSLKQSNIIWDEQLHSLQDSDFNMSAILAGMKYEYAIEQPQFYYRIPNKKRKNSSIVTEMFTLDKHQRSHLYLTQKSVDILRRMHNSHYDSAFYDGVIYTIEFHHGNTSSWQMAHHLKEIVRPYSKWMYTKLYIHIHMAEWLQKFISPDRAFTLSFFFYKLRNLIKTKSRIRKMKEICMHL